MIWKKGQYNQGYGVMAWSFQEMYGYSLRVFRIKGLKTNKKGYTKYLKNGLYLYVPASRYDRSVLVEAFVLNILQELSSCLNEVCINSLFVDFYHEKLFIKLVKEGEEEE